MVGLVAKISLCLEICFSCHQYLNLQCITSTIVNKHTGSVGATDIWTKMFTYDELTINMRQKEHGEFIELLGRVRLGVLLKHDISLLSSCKIPLKSDLVNGRMKVVAKLTELPEDTVCLLPTRHMCDEINSEVLKGLRGGSRGGHGGQKTPPFQNHIGKA